MTGPVRSDRDGVGYLLNQTARASRKVLAEELKHHGLNDTDFILLQNVSAAHAAESTVQLVELAERNNVDVEQVRSSAERLVRDGWLLSDGEPANPVLQPTEKALRAMTAFRDSARWMLERGLNGFSGNEIDQLASLLKRMLGNLS